MALVAGGKERELQSYSDLSELDMPDRHELDDAVLELIGIGSKKERKAISDDLYELVRNHFEVVRLKEEKAIENKSIAKRRGALRPTDIAQQIYKEIVDDMGRLLTRWDPDFYNGEGDWDGLEIPTEGVPSIHADMFTKHAVRFTTGKSKGKILETKYPGQAELVVLLAENGIRGLQAIPCETAVCLDLVKRYGDFVRERDAKLLELVAERTSDPELQEKVYQSLRQMVLRPERTF
jgi:hypothetical protein